MAGQKRSARKIKPGLEALDDRVTPSAMSAARVMALELRAQARARAALNRPANVAAALFHFANRPSLASEKASIATAASAQVANSNSALNLATIPGNIFGNFTNFAVLNNRLLSAQSLTNPAALILSTGISPSSLLSNSLTNFTGLNGFTNLAGLNTGSLLTNPSLLSTGFSNPALNFGTGLQNPSLSLTGFNNPSLAMTNGLVNPFLFNTGASALRPSLTGVAGVPSLGTALANGFNSSVFNTASFLNAGFANGLGTATGTSSLLTLNSNSLPTVGANLFGGSFINSTPSGALLTPFFTPVSSLTTSPFAGTLPTFSGAGLLTSNLGNLNNLSMFGTSPVNFTFGNSLGSPFGTGIGQTAF